MVLVRMYDHKVAGQLTTASCPIHLVDLLTIHPDVYSHGQGGVGWRRAG